MKSQLVNKCLKAEWEIKNIYFIYHSNISQKNTCNRSGLHSKNAVTKNLIEKKLFCLCKSDRQASMVAMNFRVNINVSKEKSANVSKTVKWSSKRHSQNYSNRQNKKSTKSVQTVSSDTPCETLNGLRKQHLSYPKYIVVGHLTINSMRTKFSRFKDFVF